MQLTQREQAKRKFALPQPAQEFKIYSQFGFTVPPVNQVTAQLHSRPSLTRDDKCTTPRFTNCGPPTVRQQLHSDLGICSHAKNLGSERSHYKD